MMKTLVAFFLFVQSLVALSEAKLYERSELWPTFCDAQESIAVGGVEIEAQTRGVLIRMEDAGGRALVDFGRKGIYVVPTLSTDILIRAQRIEQGAEVKRYPNLVELLASRIIRVQGGVAERFSQDNYSKVERFICIGFADTKEEWAKAAAWLDTQGDDVNAPEVIVLFFPEGAELSDGQILERLTAHGISNASYLYAFLASSYQRLLWSGIDTFDGDISCLELDANGKILQFTTLLEYDSCRCQIDY